VYLEGVLYVHEYSSLKKEEEGYYAYSSRMGSYAYK